LGDDGVVAKGVVDGASFAVGEAEGERLSERCERYVGRPDMLNGTGSGELVEALGSGCGSTWDAWDLSYEAADVGVWTGCLGSCMLPTSGRGMRASGCRELVFG